QQGTESYSGQLWTSKMETHIAVKAYKYLERRFCAPFRKGHLRLLSCEAKYVTERPQEEEILCHLVTAGLLEVPEKIMYSYAVTKGGQRLAFRPSALRERLGLTADTVHHMETPGASPSPQEVRVRAEEMWAELFLQLVRGDVIRPTEP